MRIVLHQSGEWASRHTLLLWTVALYLAIVVFALAFGPPSHPPSQPPLFPGSD